MPNCHGWLVPEAIVDHSKRPASKSAATGQVSGACPEIHTIKDEKMLSCTCIFCSVFHNKGSCAIDLKLSNSSLVKWTKSVPLSHKYKSHSNKHSRGSWWNWVGISCISWVYLKPQIVAVPCKLLLFSPAYYCSTRDQASTSGSYSMVSLSDSDSLVPHILPSQVSGSQSFLLTKAHTTRGRTSCFSP